MAKYYGIGGRRIKSVGNETYNISSGNNIVKKKIIKTTDAKTPEQIMQRSKLQNCVKAYRQIGSAFLKGCFKTKKQSNSCYNAFVKANVQHGSPLHRKYSVDSNILGIGVKYLAKGSLNSCVFDECTDEENNVVYGLKLNKTIDVDGTATVKDASTILLANNPGKYMEGDFINFIGLRNEGVGFKNNAQDPLDIVQGHHIEKTMANFILNKTDEATLLSKGFTLVKDTDDYVYLTLANAKGESEASLSMFKVIDGEELKVIQYCGFVLARVEKGKILTSTSPVCVNNNLKSLLDLIEANPFLRNGWWATICKVSILFSYFVEKVSEIIHDWPI